MITNRKTIEESNNEAESNSVWGTLKLIRYQYRANKGGGVKLNSVDVQVSTYPTAIKANVSDARGSGTGVGHITPSPR